MRNNQPLLFSLGLHATLIAAVFGILNITHKPKPEEIKIRLNLFTPPPEAPLTRTAVTQPKPIETPKPLPIPTPLPKPAILPPQPLAKPITPVPTKPIITPPIPTTTTQAPVPVVTKVPVKEVEATPPPPPPPVNVQAAYENENLGRIRSLLLEHLSYPKNAKKLNQQGEVTVTFTLSPNGEVSAITITKSSDFDMLDDAARNLIETTAAAFPKPSKNVRITVPIGYKLR
ncbi:MAG: TonB family protein [Sulfuricurvum sp.]|nr:TonB family protein [Sulfuricurvum sp.]